MNLILDCGVEFGDDFLTLVRSSPVTRPTRPPETFLPDQVVANLTTFVIRSTGWLHWKTWCITSRLDKRVVDKVHCTGKRTDFFFVLCSLC
jgi:hypothetical protein